MKTNSFLRFAATCLLPAGLLLAGCGKKDTPVPTPVPDMGRVMFINAASHIAPITLKFLADNTEKASLAYATGSSYQGLNVGSRAVQVTAGSQTALNQSLVIEKDKNYTFVATPAAASSNVGGLLVTDDLTVPGTGKARVRLINLGQGNTLPTPLRLSQITTTVNGPVVSDLATNVGNGSASPFIEFNANIYTLSVLDNAGNTIAVVGDGTGSGTGVYKYTEGKIYTVVLSGTVGSLNTDQKIKAYLLGNN
ncbi:MAG: DUF4397 domain-containing protein [Bacteroidota bacterium]|nr:DUF4397 domain-containing protein [Bacteroidota bacterium]